MAGQTRFLKLVTRLSFPVFQFSPCLLLAALLAVTPGGCTRRFYREHADKEVDQTLLGKDKYPGWHIDAYHVYPDPRARFADPSNPDRPPMPPDDPAAYDLSPNPQKPGKCGIERIEGQGYLQVLANWDAENRQRKAEEAAREKSEKNPPSAPTDKMGGSSTAPKYQLLTRVGYLPDPEDKPAETVPPKKKTDPASQSGSEHLSGEKAAGTEPKPLNPEAVSGGCSPRRPFLLTLEQSVELGQFNSREFQGRREDLYMTALPVTVERFAFAPQAFAAEQAIRQWAGSDTPGGQRNNWTLNSAAGIGKVLPTGGLLLLNFANQTVINLSSPVQTISTSTLNFDFIQPFLRGGGYAVALEPLTQSERNLLYEIRTYARFRKEFFVSIAGGGGGSITGGTFVPSGVIAGNTFSPTAGLGSSQLAVGFVPPATTNASVPTVVPGVVGSINLSANLPAPVSGYLGTLLQFSQIDLERKNIAKLTEFLRLFEGYKEIGDVSQLQVDQIEQQILQGRSQLILDQQQYDQALDNFKMQLGCPVDLPLELDDSRMQPLNRQFRNYEDVLAQYDAASKEADKFEDLASAARLREQLRRLFTSLPLVKGTRFKETIVERWATWEKLSKADDNKELRDRLVKHNKEKQELLNRQTDLEKEGKQLSAAQQKRLDELEAEMALGGFERSLRTYEEQPWKTVADETRRERLRIAMYRDVVNGFSLVVSEARTQRLELLHQQWPPLPRLCVNGVNLLEADVVEGQAVVAQAALTSRLDLMNVRAQVVDAWRQLKIYANALLGVFNARYHADTSTPAGKNQPLNFGGSRFHHEIILDGALPLVRKEERNNYRAAQIAYQRERRTLQEAEDFTVQTVRGEVRLLRQLAENYKIQQRQVELAYLTVENSLDQFNAPPAPTPAGAPAADTATRAASLTTQLLNAQRSLPTAQNQLLTVWINYMNTRMQLYRDIELMPLDTRGVWIDDVATSSPGSVPGARAEQHERPRVDGQPEQLPPPKALPLAPGPAPR